MCFCCFLQCPLFECFELLTAMEHVQIVAESVLKIEPEDIKEEIEEACEVDEEEEDEVKPAFPVLLHPVKEEEEEEEEEEEVLLEDSLGGELFYINGKSSADVKYEISSCDGATEIKEETVAFSNGALNRRAVCLPGRRSDQSAAARGEASPKTTAGRRTFACGVCGVRFKQRNHLSNHMRRHDVKRAPVAAPAPVLPSFPSPSSPTPPSPPPSRRPRLHHCGACGASFSLKGHLTRHLRMHTGERPYLCDVCGSGFSERATLIKHRRTHTGERPYGCADCGATFRGRQTLVTHVINHMRQRGLLVGPEKTQTNACSYGCDTCGTRFRLRRTLIIHLRTHTGERPYGCEVCGARFAELGVLKNHRRRHTGERPFLCDVCGASFSRRDCIISHMRLHTQGRKRGGRLRCAACGMYVKDGASLAEHQRTHSPAPGTRQHT